MQRRHGNNTRLIVLCLTDWPFLCLSSSLSHSLNSKLSVLSMDLALLYNKFMPQGS